MTIAIRLPTLRRGLKHEKRPRVVASRRARESLSRDTRWKRRGSGVTGKVLLGIAGLGILAAGLFLHWYDAAPKVAPLAFPDFVAQAETSFPESLSGHTRARSGTLTDGREVPVGLTMLLPARALQSAGASADALTRLAVPYVGAEPAIAGEEMGRRIAHLAALALPEGVSRCYSYTSSTPRRVAVSDTRTMNVMSLEIAFNPECGADQTAVGSQSS